MLVVKIFATVTLFPPPEFCFAPANMLESAQKGLRKPCCTAHAFN